MKFICEKKWPLLISGAFGLIAFVHLIKPNLGIDYIFLSFILLALVPWVRPLIKSFELPGGLKIELKETQIAFEKTAISTILKIDDVYQRQAVTSPELKTDEMDNLSLLRSVASSDPNLAFVGFRIEIEKRIRTLALKNNLEADRTSLGKLVNELRFKEILEPNMVTGLMDLIGLGNKAAHGAEVEPSAARWLLDVGPSIIVKLDNAINSTLSDSNDSNKASS